MVFANYPLKPQYKIAKMTLIFALFPFQNGAVFGNFEFPYFSSKKKLLLTKLQMGLQCYQLFKLAGYVIWQKVTFFCLKTKLELKLFLQNVTWQKL